MTKRKGTPSVSTRPPLIDLFAGVGGLSLGACRAGFDLRLAVENDAHAFAAHKMNFPKCAHSDADVASLTGGSLLNLSGLKPNELCGIVGGPPCQGFSTMGHRRVEDPRNLLFHRFFGLVQELQPAFFLAENVPGILDERYTLTRNMALAQVQEYTVLEPFEVVASDYGVPTIRKRVIFFGYRKTEFTGDFTKADFAPLPHVKSVTVGEALCGLPTTIKDTWLTDEVGWRVVRRWPSGPFGTRAKGKRPPGVGDQETWEMLRKEKRTSGCIAAIHTPNVINRYLSLGPKEVDRISRAARLDSEGYCPTLRAGTNSDMGSYQALRPIHPDEPRVITPREAARLQGFPDWFRFAPTKWHSFRQIGNSVSPILAEALLKSVRKKLRIAPNVMRSEDAA